MHDHETVVRGSLPTVDARTDVFSIAATAGGAAVALETRLAAQGVKFGKIAGLRISNTAAGAASIFLRTATIGIAAAQTGLGEEIPTAQSRYYAWIGGSTQLALENAHVVAVTVFFK